MIRFTWLQFRVQARVAMAALVAFAVVLMVTGPHLASLFAASGISTCHANTCATAAGAFLSRLAVTSPYPIVYLLGIGIILAAPAIIGIFWGAPLIARELETRTFALAWTQSISRTRWLVAKLAVTGFAAMLVTEALSLMDALWADPIGKAIGLQGSDPVASVFGQGRLGLLVFPTSGIAPLGYAAFAFALGTASGVFIRHAVPAMAVTLAIFAAIQIAMPLWARPHLIPPNRMTTTIEAAQLNFGSLTATVVPGRPGAWIISSGARDAKGRPVTMLPAACQGAPPPAKPLNPALCMDRRGFREAITYQPASRYWPLQWIETGIFLALAVALTGLCFWRLGRRRI